MTVVDTCQLYVSNCITYKHQAWNSNVNSRSGNDVPM